MSRSTRYYTAPVPKMPAGLIELMDGLARDVLKNNPPDVYEFCAAHMKKLLQIRDETKKPISTAKRALTLEQKITLAKKVIRERAALRREEYDKSMKVYNSKGGGKINLKTEDGATTEAGQYNKDNVIKIHEVDLSGNSEHEIVVKDIKLNEDTPLLQEGDGIANSQPIAILGKEHVNDLEDNNKHEIFIKNNKTDSVCDEDKTTEEIVSKTHECESSVENPVINIENIHLSELKDIDVPKITLDMEETKETIECSNEETENKVTLDSDKNQDVTPTTSREDMEDDTNVCNNESDEINTIDELNITVTYNPDKSGQSIDNVTQNNEMDKSQMDISVIVDNESIYNSQHDVQVSDFQNNEIFLAGKSNDIKNSELSNEANELNKQPSSIIDKNADEDKINYQELVSEVNNTSMDLETAAITIQKVFRSFLFRNKTLSSDEATNVDINLLIEDKEKTGIDDVPSNNANKDRRALGLSRIDTVLQTVNEEKSLSLSTDDSSTLSSAATIIQAHVRGFLVRNKFNLNKANSNTSGFDSDGNSTTSFEGDNDCRKNKTILNIHIVPEGGHFMSRDESMLTSIDLSVDGSPRDSTNLHPLSYDTSERRKQLKREDAIQSISPPSDNSGKQSVEVDSVKEILEHTTQGQNVIEDDNTLNVNMQDVLNKNAPNNNLTSANINNIGSVLTAHDSVKMETSDSSLPSLTSDEMDVVTPFATDSDNDSRIMHSGEFHDVVLPTKVTRTDTSVVREFQNVLVYFLLWNNA